MTMVMRVVSSELIGYIGFKPVFNILKKSWQHIRKTTDKRRNAARKQVDFI